MDSNEMQNVVDGYLYTSFYKSVESSTLSSSTGEPSLVAIQPHQPVTSQPACHINELTISSVIVDERATGLPDGFQSLPVLVSQPFV